MPTDQVPPHEQPGGDVPPSPDYSYTATDVADARRFFSPPAVPPTLPADFRISYSGDRHHSLTSQDSSPVRDLAATVLNLHQSKVGGDQTKVNEALEALRKGFEKQATANGLSSLPDLAKQINKELEKSGLEVRAGEDGRVSIVNRTRNGVQPVADFTVADKSSKKSPSDTPREVKSPVTKEQAQLLSTDVKTLNSKPFDSDSWRNAKERLQEHLDRAYRDGGNEGVAALTKAINQHLGGTGLEVRANGGSIAVTKDKGYTNVARLAATPSRDH